MPEWRPQKLNSSFGQNFAGKSSRMSSFDVYDAIIIGGVLVLSMGYLMMKSTVGVSPSGSTKPAAV